jgi:tRNA pseudouridine38-40 synthase
MNTESSSAKRVFMEICYDGADYCGWQIQPNAITVQEVIEATLNKFFTGQRLRLTGSSRTDTGVHALGFVASFDLPEKPIIPLDKLHLALNRALPESIKIRRMDAVDSSFHPRYDAKGKAYTYIFNRGPISPFSAHYSWQMLYKLDIDRIRQAVKYLEGTHDFSSFACEGGTKMEHKVRTIYRIDLQEFGPYLCITFIGDGFLYKMVRSMIGTLREVGTGQRKPDELKAILAAGNRDVAGKTAPGCGLFLMKVFYGKEDPASFKLERLPFEYPMVD